MPVQEMDRCYFDQLSAFGVFEMKSSMSSELAGSQVCPGLGSWGPWSPQLGCV